MEGGTYGTPNGTVPIDSHYRAVSKRSRAASCIARAEAQKEYHLDVLTPQPAGRRSKYHRAMLEGWTTFEQYPPENR
jgi:hypothetical protein